MSLIRSLTHNTMPFHVYRVEGGGVKKKLPVPVHENLVKQILANSKRGGDFRRETHLIIERALGRGVPYLISDGEKTIELRKYGGEVDNQEEEGEQEQTNTGTTDADTDTPRFKDPTSSGTYIKHPVAAIKPESFEPVAESARPRFPLPAKKSGKKAPKKTPKNPTRRRPGKGGAVLVTV